MVNAGAAWSNLLEISSLGLSSGHLTSLLRGCLEDGDKNYGFFKVLLLRLNW
jgi:hypothetical protein